MTRKRILLAEDHIAMRDTIVKMLEPEFEVVGVVDNGKNLLEAAERMHPDVVVIDITLPILNGIEAAHRLREANSTAKVIFLTMHEDPDFVRAALAAGGKAYVVKSRMSSDLLSAINEALADHLFVSPSIPLYIQDEADA